MTGCRTLLCLVSASLAWAFASAVAAQPAPAASASRDVSPEPFFRHGDHDAVLLSPSGRSVALLVPVQGRLKLAVFDFDARSARVIASIADYDISSPHWVNDKRLVFSVIERDAGLGAQRGGGLFAVDRDGTNYVELAPTWQKLMNQRQFAYRYTRLLATLDDGTDDVLVTSNRVSEKTADVYRLNTRTGAATRITFDHPPDGRAQSWVADRSGVARAVITVDDADFHRVWWRASADAKWVEIGRAAIWGPSVVPVTFDGDGTLIVASNVGRDTYALQRYDGEKHRFTEVVAEHPQFDLTQGLVFDRRKKRIVGLFYEAEKPGSVWFDDDWARLQKAVDDALPGKSNRLWRGDGPQVLVFSRSDTDPGRYYLLDAEKRRLEPMVEVRSGIRPDEMPSREFFRYAARDGLSIPAYLTLPKGAAPKALPLVVLVHGGPWVRGATWEFSPEPAYLASLGYAVVEPQFRGSEGFGRKLLAAGFKQWGRAMQDDLDDAVDYLAAKGTIDPSRACIMGASYGGYAVMMGLARNPERWRCGIDIVGVTDINLMFDVTWSDSFGSPFMRATAKTVIGDPDKDAAMLKASSPLANASRIKAPVLMAYGAEDRRVPLVHGTSMRDALPPDTPVEWVAYKDEGHGFMLEENRFDLYRRVARFLAKYNAPR
jgi:dipeptidyl aminopeptidase/acylaminoacyl peptidase